MRNIYFKALVILLVFCSVKLSATDYYCKATGVITSTATWGTNNDGTGTSPANFSGSHIWHFANRAAATLTTNFSVSTATIVVESGFNLTVSGGPPGGGAITGKVDAASNGTFTIGNNKTYVLNTLDANSTVVYNFAGNTVKSANYGNLVIAASTSLAASVNVNGALTINSGRTLTMSSFGLFIYGSVSSMSGSGTITGDANAFIELYGGNGGNNGTLNFTSGAQTLDYIYINYDNATDYITLGTDLGISFGAFGTFFQVTGGIDLNGRTLTVNSGADASFAVNNGDGYVRGSSGAIIINGTIGAFSGSTNLFMDPSVNTLKALTLNATGQILDAGNTLNISDSLAIHDGDLNTNNNVTLKSTSSLKGRLGLLTGNLNGNLTVETFALGGSTGWAELGVSGISGQTFNNWYGQIPMSIEGSTTGVTSAGGYYFESVQGWNEADSYGYDSTLTVSSPLTPGVGYWVYLGNGATTTTDMLWTVSGTPVSGNVNIPLTNSAQTGYNLIANPYASPISWTKLRNGNTSVNNAIYIYNADGPYVTFVNGVGTNGGTDNIAMGQGFYVQATGNTNLTATEGVKSSANTVQLFKTTSSSNTSNIGLVFKLKLNGPYLGDNDETAFRFHSSATNVFDTEWDARKLFATPGYAGYPGAYSKYTSISSKGAANEDYSVNSLPALMGQSVTIPVLVKVAATGSYTISPVDLQNFANPSCVILKDKLLNVSHQLSNGPYVCTINDTTSTARFELQICAQNMPTSINQGVSQVLNNVLIGQDQYSPFVTTSFEQNTKATISVYNVIGQKLVDDIKVQGTENTTRLNLNVHNQVVIVRVTTDTQSYTKKIIVH